MVHRKKDSEREDRITMEIVVDAYNEQERAMGWYCYLEGRLSSFTAECVEQREVSPLEVGDQVHVLGMASDDDCAAEMFVRIRWNKRTLAVPLSQLKPVDGDDELCQAVEDWRYWSDMEYQF